MQIRRSSLEAFALPHIALLAATLIAVLFLGAPTPAAATVLCGARNHTTGQLREGASLHVRTACRATEVQAKTTDLGLAATLTVRSGSTISTNGVLSTLASCDPGELATGGGALAIGNDGGIAAVRATRPQPDDDGAHPTAWRTTVANLASAGTITVTSYVVCLLP